MNRKNPYISDDLEYELSLIKLGRYNLECYIFNKNTSRPAIFIWDRELNSYNKGGDFFSYDWDINLIKEDLLTTIDEVVDRDWGDEILGNNFTLMSAIICPQKTFFTTNNDIDEGLKDAKKKELMWLATSTFKDISLKWLEFLESLKR